MLMVRYFLDVCHVNPTSVTDAIWYMFPLILLQIISASCAVKSTLGLSPKLYYFIPRV